MLSFGSQWPRIVLRAMASDLEGRWLLEDPEGNTSFAVIKLSSTSDLEVTFVEDPETTLRIVMEDEEVVMLSRDGEEVCRGKLVQTAEGQTLQLQSEGTQETWCKIKPDVPKVVSRKLGGKSLPRIFTKETNQSKQSEVE